MPYPIALQRLSIWLSVFPRHDYAFPRATGFFGDFLIRSAYAASPIPIRLGARRYQRVPIDPEHHPGVRETPTWISLQHFHAVNGFSLPHRTSPHYSYPRQSDSKVFGVHREGLVNVPDLHEFGAIDIPIHNGDHRFGWKSNDAQVLVVGLDSHHGRDQFDNAFGYWDGHRSKPDAYFRFDDSKHFTTTDSVLDCPMLGFVSLRR